MYIKNVVRDTPRGVKYPAMIPKKRTNSHQVLFITLLAIQIILLLFFDPVKVEFDECLKIVALPILLIFFQRVLLRLCLLIEERNYLHSRYEGNWKQLLKTVMDFNKTFLAVVAIAFIIYLSSDGSLVKFPTCKLKSAIFPCLTTISIMHFFKDENDVLESIALENSKGLDIGTENALMYFYGYLKQLLPSHGLPENGLKNFISQYEARHEVELECKILYILIPLSMDCPENLADRSEIVKESKPLQPVVRNVAGVLKRYYRNQVYKIFHEGRFKYVCAEYASNFFTLNKVIQRNVPNADYYRRHQKDIFNNYYGTLKRLIELDPETKGLCKLIYFNDVVDGKNVDVGEILLNATAASHIEHRF